MAEKRTALITGGASGIGAAFARILSGEGIHVVIADRQLELAQDVARQLGESGEAVELDVTDAAAFASCVADVKQRHGRLDYFFNNAGIGIGGSCLDHDLADWKDMIAVNISGVAYGINAVYPLMVEQGHGQIINTSSMAGLIPQSQMIAYTASKHAVYAMSQAMRPEAARYGVRVNALCPGFINTPILTGGAFGRMKYDEETRQELAEEIRSTTALDVDVFARKAWQQIKNNRSVIILPFKWRVIWWIYRLSPTLMLKLFYSIMNKRLEDLK